MGESNQIKWVGVRQTDPPESFHVQNRPATGTQQICYNFVSNSILNMLTVPSGHIYHVVGCNISIYPSVQGYGDMSLCNDAGDILAFLGFGFYTDAGCVMTPIIFVCPLLITATQKINIESSADGFWVYGSVIYYDEVL